MRKYIKSKSITEVVVDLWCVGLACLFLLGFSQLMYHFATTPYGGW